MESPLPLIPAMTTMEFHFFCDSQFHFLTRYMCQPECTAFLHSWYERAPIWYRLQWIHSLQWKCVIDDPVGRSHIRHLLTLSCSEQEVTLWIQELSLFLKDMVSDLTDVQWFHELLTTYPRHTQPVFHAYFRSYWQWMKRKDLTTLYLDHFADQRDDTICTMVYDHMDRLHNHPVGNYLIQWLIKDPYYRARYLRGYHGQIGLISQQKFSSIVMETCIELECIRPTPPFMNMMDELIQAIPNLIQHMYGNYVLQTALRHAPPDVQSRMTVSIESTLATLRDDIRQKWSMWIDETRDETRDTNTSTPEDPFDPVVNLERLLQSIESF